jgi:polygalacturonase
VVIDGITVESHANYNNDMIDVDGCRNVRISNCTGDTGDDAITLKSVVGGPCRNITVTNCVLSSHSNAIKLGTESTGGFENIAITNCAIRPAHTDQFHLGDRRGLAGIALEIVDGGTLDRVTISNIVIEGTTAPIFLRLGDRGRTYPGGPEHPSVGTFRNVVISNVIATGVKNTGCAITGLPDHPIENITLCNINITYAGGGAATSAERTPDEHPNRYPECTMFGELPAYGFYVRHARGVTFDNVRLVCEKPDARPAIACDDVQDLRLANIATNASADATLVQLQDVQNALIRDCFLPTTTRPFLQCDGACRNIIGIDR